MALSKHVWKELENQEKIVLDIKDPRVDLFAKKIAFYAAMIDAAKDDPMDDPDDQTEILESLELRLKHDIVTYQNLVNEYL